MSSYLLETDQVVCYDQDGRVVDCEGTGQDAAISKMHAKPLEGRFVSKTHVVEDRLTGAIWTRNANPFGFPQEWRESQRTVAKMCEQQMHGYSDWQLPSRDLLFSLISHQYVNPALAAKHPFENIFNGFYWTKDSSSRLPDQAWYIHMGGGRIHRGMKHGSYLIWPVCPGPGRTQDAAWKNMRDHFSIVADSVYDKRTGLNWLLDANPIGRPLSWEAALSAIKVFNAEHTGFEPVWRMPNIRELESLVALDAHTPAISESYPFVNVQDAYWSSTTSVYEPSYAWTLYCQDGYVGVGHKPQEAFYLWPVRSSLSTESLLAHAISFP
jgi:hypothetical protein